jgi:PAS domain S-box-containing protein
MADTDIDAALQFFGQMGMGVYRSTPDGKLLHVNQPLAFMLGYHSAKELMERGVSDDDYHSDTPRSVFVHRIERDGYVRGLLATWRHRDGHWVHVREAARAVRGDDGTTQFYEGYVEDRSEQVQAEQALRRNEEQLRALLDNTSVGFYRTTPDGQVLFANPAMVRMSGYDSLEAMADVDVNAAYVDTSGPRSEWIERIEREGEITGYVTTWKRGDGATIQVKEDARRVTDPEGRTLYYEGTVVDLTELVEAQETLRQREAQLRTLIDRSPIGIAIDTPDGGFLETNPAFCELLGRTPEELRTLGAADLSYDPEETKWVAPLIAELHAGTRDMITVERRYKRPDGTPVDCLTSVAGVSEGGRHIYSIVMIVDISDRKRLESAARQAQKLDAVGRLAGGIAHDFNNLLTAIAGHAAFARRAAAERKPVGDELLEIQRACDRAAELTKRLLSFSRSQVMRPQRLDLGPRLIEFEQMLRRVIPESVAINTSVAPGVHVVQADPTQLEQVVLNLVLNARDAMPEGGRIDLHLDTQELDAEAAEALGIRPGPYVRLRVQDTGEGIAEGAAERLFEPFFTTKSAGKGSGLGLATAYGIVNQSGGTIRAANAEAGGAVFEVLLPRVGGELKTPPVRRRRTPDPERGTETVLLVEDEESLRALMERVLRRSGYTVLSAMDGESALRALEESGAPPDLLVTDVVMPRMKGTELAARAREQQPGLRVLYVSGFVGDEEVMAKIRASGIPLLSKPFTPSGLEQAVRTCLDVIF